MKSHPVQHDFKNIERLAEIFRESMERNRVLPKNPWKAEKLEKWLAKMGARFKPESHRYRSAHPVDCENYVNFRVACADPGKRANRNLLGAKVRVEIPWELADRALVLGYLP